MLRGDGESPMRAGRRKSIDTMEIFHRAMEMFVEHGYDKVSVDDIASEVGISRRTLFRYVSSKAAIVWGDFGAQLARMQPHLEADETNSGRPIREDLIEALVSFNTFPQAETRVHRSRMRLISQHDELVAYSTLVYADWLDLIARYVAKRRSEDVADIVPQATARALLGAAEAAYQRWIAETDADQQRLHELLRTGASVLA